MIDVADVPAGRQQPITSDAIGVEPLSSVPVSRETVLSVPSLSIVPEGAEFLVGDPLQGEYVLLPAVGLRVLQLLQDGRSVGAVMDEIGPDVDVPDFIETVLALGLVSRSRTKDVLPMPDEARPRRIAPGLVRPFFGRPAWLAYTVCAALVLAILGMRPDLRPTAQDIFFLPSPLASVTCITLLTYLLATIHEICHWAAARAEGLDARVTISRRLYFLAFETDLTQLWGLPRRRRYSALLAGMAFDAVLLCGALLLRVAASSTWWHLPEGADHWLAALAFVELAALIAQAYVFARTDLYAVLVTGTGCINLWRINQLRLLNMAGRLNADQKLELAGAHARDLSVARWYSLVYVGGLLLAAWFFVAYYLPATLHLVGWLIGVVAAAEVTTFDFWAALAFAVIVLSPHVLTAGVAVRELRRRATRWHPLRPHTAH